jgi:hypothetical protein
MRRVPKERSLAFVSPELAKEWDYEKNYPLTPEDVFAKSGKKVWWKCRKCGNTRHSSPHDIIDKNIICHRCNSLAVKNPKLIKEWNTVKNGKLTPYDVSYCSGKKVWWKCKKGHQWISTVAHRNNGRGCPYCFNKKICIDNCLGTLMPNLAREWDYDGNKKTGLTPNNVSVGSSYVKIGLGQCSCDFYLKDKNKYVEVTGYSSESRQWEKYYKNILRKKKYITECLKADFEFIQIKLTPNQRRYVRLNEI